MRGSDPVPAPPSTEESIQTHPHASGSEFALLQPQLSYSHPQNSHTFLKFANPRRWTVGRLLWWKSQGLDRYDELGHACGVGAPKSWLKANILAISSRSLTTPPESFLLFDAIPSDPDPIRILISSSSRHHVPRYPPQYLTIQRLYSLHSFRVIV